MQAKLYYCGQSHTSHYAQAVDGNLYWWRRGSRFRPGHWRKSHHNSIERIAQLMGDYHQPKLIGYVTMTGKISRGSM